MSDTVSPVLQDVFTVLQPFIVSSIGIASNLVIQGIPNRTAMPAASPGFIVMTVLRQARIRTNGDTYDITNPAPTVISIEQGIELDIQIDCYGASSGDWAAILTTLLRDDVGCQALAPTCQPLYCDDARMIPLTDSEDQYELRFSFTACLQYNPVITVPMNFADTLTADLIDVQVTYPI
jgi:hypothetical protein